jgi:two-component system, chemotaxis family, response regulator WspR
MAAMEVALRHSRTTLHALTIDPFQQIADLESRNAELAETNRQLKRDFQRVQRLAYLDPLTGLGNRRYFDSVAASELQRAARTRKPLTLFICDVDNFKHFNDAHGHDMGDVLLTEVATVLRKHCRRGGDLAIRYAGDEFALLLPGVHRHMAVRFAAKLRAAVQAASISYGGHPIAERVTLSVGAAVFRGIEPCPATALVTAADRALYRAKRAGRNRSVIALCPGSSVAGD